MVAAASPPLEPSRVVRDARVVLELAGDRREALGHLERAVRRALAELGAEGVHWDDPSVRAHPLSLAVADLRVAEAQAGEVHRCLAGALVGDRPARVVGECLRLAVLIGERRAGMLVALRRAQRRACRELAADSADLLADAVARLVECERLGSEMLGRLVAWGQQPVTSPFGSPGSGSGGAVVAPRARVG